MLYTQSENYVKLKFNEYFVEHPAMGIQRLEFAKRMIGEENKLSEETIKKVLGWSIEGQLKGYAKGAFRRIQSKIK